MKKKIDKFVTEFILPSAKTIIEKMGHEHSPMFFINGKDGIIIAVTNFTNYEEKVACREEIKQICAKNDADYYIFVSEGWQIERKEIIPNERPSKAKDRQEVLQVLVNERDGKLVGYMCKIKKKGKKRVLGKPLKLEGLPESLFKIEW